MQVDPIKPTLKAPGAKRLKLICADPLSNFPCKFNLRRYTTGDFTLYTFANNIRVSQVLAESLLLLAIETDSDYWKTVAAQNAVQPQQQLQAGAYTRSLLSST